jgi:hypothetical protein
MLHAAIFAWTPTCCAITGISHVQARSVSNGNDGYEAVINEWKNRRSRKVKLVVLSCGDCSRTTVCCLSGAVPYTHSSPILTQLAHLGFFSQHWKNDVSKNAIAKQSPCLQLLTFTLRVLHIKQPPRDLRWLLMRRRFCAARLWPSSLRSLRL